MEDFRSRLTPRQQDPNRLNDLLQQGKLAAALRMAKALGIAQSELQSKIQHAAREMFYGRRVGELLSCLGELEVPLPYDVPMLLNRLFDYGDYHSFLKQAYRLRVKAGSEGNIAAAIEAIAKRAPIEAAAWRRKFDALP